MRDYSVLVDAKRGIRLQRKENNVNLVYPDGSIHFAHLDEPELLDKLTAWVVRRNIDYLTKVKKIQLSWYKKIWKWIKSKFKKLKKMVV